MKQSNRNDQQHLTPTIGLDLGDQQSHYFVLGADGCELDVGQVATTQKGMTPLFQKHRGSLLVLEVGGHSGWVSRLAQECGLTTEVANARKLALISQNDHKNDRTDAELLARLGRFDRKLLHPIRHRSAQAQADLAVLRARHELVSSRVALINHVRGQVKCSGARLKQCSTASFHKQARTQIPFELNAALMPMLAAIEAVTSQIDTMDRQIAAIARDRYPRSELLQQVKGVGPVISLQYVLTLDDPARFKHSRQVGPYLGMTPRTRASGDSDPQLRITKAGDRALRRLLVIGANFILGPKGPDCDLKRFGEKIAARGGKNARKRAKVAVARKLAVLLHRLWRTGEEYDPFYSAKRRGEALPV